MIEEIFADTERHRLIGLVLAAMAKDDCTLNNILSKLTGTDTVVVVRRAYRSQARLQPSAREQLQACYNNPNFPRRHCCNCDREYTGPSMYCSLECVEARQD